MMPPLPETLPPSPPPLDSNEKLLALACHLSSLVSLPFILPLIIYLVKTDSPFVRENARQALNFHLTLIPVVVLSFLLCFVLVGFLILPLVVLAALILSIIAAVRASEGQIYHYPLSIPFIR